MNSLKREVTLSMLVFYGLGNILGAGIYVLIGKIAGISGIYANIIFIGLCSDIFYCLELC
jgi:amino acid transporter